MALTNYEKQKRWREKNRALYNLQQRNRRKTKGGEATCSEKNKNGNTQIPTKSIASNAAPTVQPARAAKIEELRELMEAASREPVESVVKPLVYRDDYGRIISEAQWKRLQERKEHAKQCGFVIDQYSQ